MIFSNIAGKSYQIFLNLIEENISLFEDAIEEQKSQVLGQTLTDDQFVQCYLDGINRITDKLNWWVNHNLSGEPQTLERYNKAITNPSTCGFKFSNPNLTIGKIYLSYVWAKTKKKASKADCIKLEKYTVSLIGKKCLEAGLVS